MPSAWCRRLGAPVHADSPEGFLAAGTVNGELYALPAKYNNKGTMWYRPDLFEAAGVTPPKTWDEFKAALETLKDEKDRQAFLDSLANVGTSEVDVRDEIRRQLLLRELLDRNAVYKWNWTAAKLDTRRLIVNHELASYRGGFQGERGGQQPG